MEYTTNLNLKKPTINEYYNVTEQENANMDIIDEAVGTLNSQVGTETLTTTAQDCTGAINELNKNMNEKGVYPLITTEQGGTITIPDITQYDLLIFYMDVNSADTTIGATQQFTFVVSHLVNRYGQIYFTGKGGNDDTNAYVIFDSATSFRVLKTADVNAEPTVNAVYGVKL